ncbi:MAG TPA: GNAT family protein [candidate division Zixibacteria bacterium]|nr:GNAT family protein [candidate division Zixibacteria bacterium]
MNDKLKERRPKLVFLNGKKTILRPLRKATDFESFWRWVNDPEVRRYWTVYLPATERKVEELFDFLTSKPGQIAFGIETLEGNLIGMMVLLIINDQDRTAISDTLIGEKGYWNKGYGTDAKMMLLNYAFNTLKLRKINSCVVSHNKRSLQYNLHCGYKIEAVRKRQIFHLGRFRDEILLAVFKPDWFPVWKKYQKTGAVH